MSDLQNTTATETPVTEPTVAPQTDIQPEAEHCTDARPESKTDEILPVSESKTEAKRPSSGVEEKKEEAVAKPVEPITEGQLTLKGPGLLKSIIPSKKEFWLSDDAFSHQDLSSYMRGEKPEIAHPVVAWASQTGKGLLFFNKKGDTTRKQPGHVLALYDVIDLKKESPHEISFKLNGQELVLKATSDAERDGWYMSIEKASEVGKAHKDEIRESEGYKAEMEKLNKPSVAANGAAVGAKRSQSQPKKSTEVEKSDSSQRKNSEVEEEDKKEQKKSRSASRGLVERLKGKKDEKKEEKKEEKAETEESKPAEEHKTEEATAGAATITGAAIMGGALSDDKKDETVESPVESTPKTEEKTKKRGSIFGKIPASWGSLKSPTKEKEQKDAELKPEVPAKDTPVSENPPQIPESSTEPVVIPATEEPKDETEAKPVTEDEKKDVSTPSKEKPKFLSGLSFMNKRSRSVSPSANTKDEPAVTEAAPAEVPKEAEAVEPGKADEAIAETTAIEPLKPEEKTEKEAKRQSVLGSLGRRASKAFKGFPGPKKENTAPTIEAKKEETAEAAPVMEEPITNGESKPAESQQPNIIGDVIPEAVNIGKPEHQPAAVTASA